MSSLPAIKPVLEFLAPAITEAYENSPALPQGQKGRSPSPVLTKNAEDLINWAKSSPENMQAYKAFRDADRKWKDHLDAVAGMSDDGFLETEGAELKRAKAALEQEVDKFINPELKARIAEIQETLKPLLKEIREQEKEANKDPEVIRLTNLVDKMKSENSESTALASVCQLASHVVEAFRANKEPKLERGQPWYTVYTAFGLADPTKVGTTTEEADNTVEA